MTALVIILLILTVLNSAMLLLNQRRVKHAFIHTNENLRAIYNKLR